MGRYGITEGNLPAFPHRASSRIHGHVIILGRPIQKYFQAPIFRPIVYDNVFEPKPLHSLVDGKEVPRERVCAIVVGGADTHVHWWFRYQ